MLKTGINFNPEVPGTISEFEEREAAQWLHYTWSEWVGLGRIEKVAALAHYRLRRLIDLHAHDASVREQRRRESRQRRKRV